MSDDQRADTPPHDHEWVWHHDWWGAHVCGVDGCLAVRESPPVDAEAAAEPAALVAAVRRMVEDGHPNDPDWFRIITEHLHKAESEPAAAEPPYLTLVAVQNALDEAWLESGDAQGQGRPPDLARHLLEALREYVAIEAEAAAEPAARGDFPNPPDEDPPDFPIPIEPPPEPAAAEPPDLVSGIAYALARADLPASTETARDYATRLAPLVLESGWLRAAQSPRGSLPDEVLITDHWCPWRKAHARLVAAGGSLTATEPPAVTALRELMEAMEACRVAADESVKRAGSAKDAFGQSEDIMGPALDRLAAAEEQARSLLQDSGSPRGVTVAADRPALDVERLAVALTTHQHDAAVVGYCYKGHGEDAKREAEQIAAEYARLGSEPTALPKSPEDSDG